MQFDARPDSPDSDTPIDLPLQDRESVGGAELPASRDELLFQEPSSSSGGRGFGAGMLVIGLVAGFAGGFLVGQRVAPPPPRPSAAQVTPPAVSGSRTAPEPPVAPAQNFTEAPVADPPPSVEVRKPEVEPPVARTAAPPRAGVRGGDPGPAQRGAVARPTTDTQPGTLQIASRPAGATVYVDDLRVGITPMMMSNVKPGAHRVRIELPGHRPWATSVNVDAGAQARVGASLEP